MNASMFRKLTGTLRGRLTLWYLTSTGIVFFLFAVSVTGLFRVILENQIDHHIHIAVNEAHEIVQQYRGEDRDALIRNLVSAQGMTVVVLSPDGAPVLETNSPDIAAITEHQLQRILTTTGLDRTTPVHFTQGNIRFAAMPVSVNAGRGIVAVGYATDVLNETFYGMIGIVAAAVILFVLPAAVAGYRLLRRQLAPLESIAGQAQSVSQTSDLSRRIHADSSTQELRRIQSAFNAMLTKLEDIFAGERSFFSDAAHTLKTPLAVLRSQIEHAGIPARDRQGMLATIDTATDTIQDLILLSRISLTLPEAESVPLSRIMNDLAELASTLGKERRLTVTADIQPRVTVRGNTQLIRKAISNLVVNAITYNKPGGSVTLRLATGRGGTVISVRDTGIGIPGRDRPNVFRRFFRGTNATGNGSGLGLSITKASVEAMGGAVNVSSTVGKGTTVTVTLPQRTS